MAQNPDPNLALANNKGVTRTLDDWCTTFNLACVVLPDRMEAAAWIPVIDRMYRTLGESDARTTICVGSTPAIAKRILGDAFDRYLVFCDPDHAFATSLGLKRLPAFVHLRQDTTLVSAAQGWSVSEWQKVVDGIAKHVHWIAPIVAGSGNPPASPGWELTV